MADDDGRSFRAGREGRTPPLFDKNFDRNSYNQGRTVRAWDTSSKPNTESSSAPGCLAILAFIAIIAFFPFIKWMGDIGKKKAEDAQYSNITPVPVKVSNPFAYLQAEPYISSKRAECVGTCPGAIGAAVSIMQQGAVPGWVRLIAQYPNGYIKGWLPANDLQTDSGQLGWPHPHSKLPQQVGSHPPKMPSETEPRAPQQEVPRPPSSPTSDIDPNKPPTQVVWPPEGYSVTATHLGFNGCDGQLTLKTDGLEFRCGADQTTLTVPIADVKGPHNNGVETLKGHPRYYHFSIPHNSNDQTAALFAQWFQACKSNENQPTN